MPVIVILFFFLSILEDSGYMARVAFVMDKPLRHLGPVSYTHLDVYKRQPKILY